MNDYLLISDAAKEVNVESHVLRYWEEELHLPIKRNELGHRYYTKEDVERFKQIKGMKEQGLQLKAIKMILKDGKLSVLEEGQTMTTGNWEQENQSAQEEPYLQQGEMRSGQSTMAIDIVDKNAEDCEVKVISREDKSQRLQWLLRQLILDTLQENNQELCREIKESVVKELDYQFRNQEEREEERERLREQRNDEYYKKMDELLRKKSRGGLNGPGMKEKKEKKEKKVKTVTKKEKNNIMDIQTAAKKKRHSFF